MTKGTEIHLITLVHILKNSFKLLASFFSSKAFSQFGISSGITYVSLNELSMAFNYTGSSMAFTGAGSRGTSLTSGFVASGFLFNVEFDLVTFFTTTFLFSLLFFEFCDCDDYLSFFYGWRKHRDSSTNNQIW